MGRYIFLCFFVLFGFPAFAQVDADALLEQVFADAAQRAEAAKDKRFSYEMSIKGTKDKDTDKEPVDVVMHFDPSLEREQQWSIVSPTEAENPDVYAKAMKRISDGIKNTPDAMPDRALMLKVSSMSGNKNLALAREENGIAIFGFDLDKAYLNSDGGTAGSFGKMAEKLAGEISVDISSKQLIMIRIFAKESFKPVAVARIKKLDIQLHYAPAWEGGPIFQVRNQMNLSGSALFKKFSQQMDVVYSNFVAQPQ